jgi:hypothetical protein
MSSEEMLKSYRLVRIVDTQDEEKLLQVAMWWVSFIVVL